MALARRRPDRWRALSQSEIAGQAGLPLGTVKTIARRALLRMRMLLGGPPPAGALVSVEPAEVES